MVSAPAVHVTSEILADREVTEVPKRQLVAFMIVLVTEQRTPERLVPLRNALLPIEVTLEGMFRDPVKPEQFWNALPPIEVTLEGMFSDPVKPEQL